MEPRVATGGNRRQIDRRLKPQKQAKSVAVGCARLPEMFHGKEGSTVRVRQRALQNPRSRGFCFGSTCRFANLGQVWSPLWSLQVENAVLASHVADREARPRHSNGLGEAGVNRRCELVTWNVVPWDIGSG